MYENVSSSWIFQNESDNVARNKVDESKVSSRGGVREESNSLQKELQTKLWKKSIDFSEVDTLVNRIYSDRQQEVF